MNEIKILLDNFQSISSGELTFKTGLNFIIGQSNSGKTATFRALKALLLNPAGSQRFIKKGHSAAQVTMLYNGNEITWKRGQKDSSYIINGETYIKTGKSDVFKILDEDTGFVQGDDSAIMNIEEELQVPFPFGYSKSDLFKLYENVFCVSDSATILKSAKGNEDEVKSEISLLDNELTKNKKKLEELESFKKEINIDELKSMLSSLSKNKERIETLSDGLNLIKQLVALKTLKLPEQPILNNKVEEYNEKVKLLKTVQSLKELHSLGKSLKVEEFTSNLDKYKELFNLRRVVNHLRSINEIKVEVQSFENKLNQYKDLVSYLKEIREIQSAGKAKTAELQQAKAKVAEIENKLKEFKVCQLCHQPLNN